MTSLNWLQVALLSVTISSALSGSAQTDENNVDTWPRKFVANEKSFTIYQPQVESWQGTQLEERAAIAVETSASPEPVFGVVWLKCRTEIDKAQRLVALADLKVTKVDFPTEPDQVAAYKALIEKNASHVLGTISLDRLRASLAINNAETKTKRVVLKNDPPEIFYSDTPSILVLIDGQPVMRETGTPHLLRVANTRALIILNKADGKYNLNVAGHWYEAASVNGPWKNFEPPTTLLENLNKIRDQESKDVDTFESSPTSVAVFSSVSPAELIQTKGKAELEPIKGTELLYVTNTPDNIFMDPTDQSYFVTLSGRWFKSKSLRGPWKFTESNKLPSDFAKIPESHPKGEILASVAGTPDAEEAAIANEIPQTATVDRENAKLNVEYDGTPQFKNMDGSSLQYAANTKTAVIRVNDTKFYAVENGVWFSAPTSEGPWVVATEVPQQIYQIPPSAPVYYVTYAYVYGSDPRYVYVGYLPGYLGSYVTPSGVVVYGTGYTYVPWVHHYWYGYPATYGFGLAWGFGFGWAFRPVFYGTPVYHPWWGPWHEYWGHPEHRYLARAMTVNHLNVYENWRHEAIRPSVIRNYSAVRSARTLKTSVAHRNNVYSDHSGNIYRHDGQKWEQYHSRTWQTLPANEPTRSARVTGAASTRDLERERTARTRGETRTMRYRPQQPVQPQLKKPSRGKFRN